MPLFFSRDEDSATSCVCRSWVLEARGSKGNESHRLIYHVYFIRSVVQLEQETTFVCGDFLESVTAFPIIGASRASMRTVNMHGTAGTNLEFEGGGNLSEMGNYFITSWIPEE